MAVEHFNDFQCPNCNSYIYTHSVSFQNAHFYKIQNAYFYKIVIYCNGCGKKKSKLINVSKMLK